MASLPTMTCWKYFVADRQRDSRLRRPCTLGASRYISAKLTFALMISLKQARGFQQRLARAEKFDSARVRAGKHSGFYEVMVSIPGSDPNLRGEAFAINSEQMQRAIISTTIDSRLTRSRKSSFG